MNVDKFGRNFKPTPRNKGVVGPPGIGFKLLPSGDFDIGNKYLNNIGIKPEHPHQAVSKAYVDEQLNLKENRMRDHIDSSLKETIAAMKREYINLLPKDLMDFDEKYADEKIKTKVEKIMKTLFPKVPFIPIDEK